MADRARKKKVNRKHSASAHGILLKRRREQYAARQLTASVEERELSRRGCQARQKRCRNKSWCLLEALAQTFVLSHILSCRCSHGVGQVALTTISQPCDYSHVIGPGCLSRVQPCNWPGKLAWSADHIFNRNTAREKYTSPY